MAEFCRGIREQEKFREFVFTNEELKEFRVHPRQEMRAKSIWCNPPWCGEGDVIPPKFILHVDPTMPEYEIQMVFTGHTETIKLN